MTSILKTIQASLLTLCVIGFTPLFTETKAADELSAMLTLRLSVPDTNYVAGSPIPVTVTITNRLGNTFTFLSTKRTNTFPFELYFWTESGNLLNPREYRSSQNHSLRVVDDLGKRTVTLAPNEVRTYNYLISDYTDANGDNKPIPPGKYSLQVLLVVATNDVTGRWRSKVVDSNLVKVEVGP